MLCNSSKTKRGLEMSDAGDENYGTVRQSFARGRTRLVQVERRPIPERKAKGRAELQAEENLCEERETEGTSRENAARKSRHTKQKKLRRARRRQASRPFWGKAHEKRNKKRKNRNREHEQPPAKPSFQELKETIYGPDYPPVADSKARKRARGRRGGGFTTKEGSAGLPGNEHRDPPARSSRSTPLDRYRGRIGRT